MMNLHRQVMDGLRGASFLLALGLAIGALPAAAADHGDAPMASADRSTDIADVYAFLDPNDNQRVTLIFNTGGFIVPGEAANFGYFDSALRYRLELETNGDAVADRFIDVTFEKRRSAANESQMATITLPSGRRFRALTTASTTTSMPNDALITTDSQTGVRFFAGLVDDPFFFDIPAFTEFVRSTRAGTPNRAILQRGRDSFAGYNTISIAFSIPIAQLGLRATAANPAGRVLGVQGVIQRQEVVVYTNQGPRRVGLFTQVERMGNPGTNVVLIPFPRKDEQNLGTPLADAGGQFRSDIVSFLKSLGTDDTSIGIVTGLVVTRGDFLRLDIRVPNRGPAGGNNVGAGFPNGRRLGDDVIDTTLFLINNRQALGDRVDRNDVPLRDVFPFVAPPQASRPNGVTDDNTRN
jgi:hypothetical protein